MAQFKTFILQCINIRKSKGLTQIEIAKRMGTSQSAVARLESGDNNVELATVYAYAEAIEVGLKLKIDIE